MTCLIFIFKGAAFLKLNFIFSNSFNIILTYRSYVFEGVRKVYNYFVGGYHHPPKRNRHMKKSSPNKKSFSFFLLKLKRKMGVVDSPSSPKGIAPQSFFLFFLKIRNIKNG